MLLGFVPFVSELYIFYILILIGGYSSTFNLQTGYSQSSSANKVTLVTIHICVHLAACLWILSKVLMF